MPVSRHRKVTKKNAAQSNARQPSKALAATWRDIWRNASVTQKGGAVLAAAVVIGGVSYAIRTARLPKVCYHSESSLPSKTSIYAGLGDKGNMTSEAERLALIEGGLNQELENVKAKDVGVIFDRNLNFIGRFAGVNAVLQTDKPVSNLPTKYTLTIAKQEIEIDPQDTFKVTATTVTIGQHSFPINDVVSIVKRRDVSVYLVPNGRVSYHLIGKNPRYSCATP